MMEQQHNGMHNEKEGSMFGIDVYMPCYSSSNFQLKTSYFGNITVTV